MIKNTFSFKLHTYINVKIHIYVHKGVTLHITQFNIYVVVPARHLGKHFCLLIKIDKSSLTS
jgi:hypothetical protein